MVVYALSPMCTSKLEQNTLITCYYPLVMSKIAIENGDL